jgi:ribonuclease BN (tRNA processing enzyme)
MTEHILEAYQIDIETRTNSEGNQRAISNGWKVNAHEIESGIVYKDGNVTVTAFPTKHAMTSYGYRFDTSDRRIVISGDTGPTEETIKACSGCDILIHDAQTLDLYAKMPERLHSFVAKYHTTTAQLAALAAKANPKLLVTYHTIAFRPGIAPPKFLSSISTPGASRSTEEILEDELGSRYSGRFIIGHDLDVY